ncbi:MAG: recombinase family protein [Oscillospiraceae bacterium]|nr:recombinase family protein [Oscillospiraceae bacterium]
MANKKKKDHGGNAVIYARYSSHNQSEVSIEQQVDACEKYAARNGYTVVDRYADRAVSGRTDKRPAFQKMMKDARSGSFDYVIAWKSNRIGRNMIQAMNTAAALAALGVACLYVEEDFDDTASGRFALRNMMNVNQFYSENMAEDIRRGMLDSASRGCVNSKPPYGYRRGADGRFEIDEPAAAVVRQIFDRVLGGWSIFDIMTDLNRRGIRTGSGGEWKKQSFGRLLSNDRYTGRYHWDEIVIEDGMPAIVDRSTFDRVQLILKTKKKPRGKQRMNDEYLLSGKLFCGECGSPMSALSGTGKSGKKFMYYTCNRRRYEHACEKKNVPKDVIEKQVLEYIRSQLMNDEFIDWVVAGYDKVVAEIRADSERLQLDAELKDVNRRIKNMLQTIEMGVINEATQ